MNREMMKWIGSDAGESVAPSPFRPRARGVRWLDYSRRSWQRLGHLKAIASLASKSEATSLEGLAHRFQDMITMPVDVPPPSHEDYRAYASLFRRIVVPRDRPLRAEIQDLYLADRRLPSRSGAITGDSVSAGYRHAVYVEIPAWAVRLSLLRSGNYTLTDRGRALLQLRSTTREAFHTYIQSSNPYLLSRGEAYFLLYCLLDSDGDILKAVLPQLAACGQSGATRSQIGEAVAEALRNIAQQTLFRHGVGPATEAAARMRAVAAAVDKQKAADRQKPTDEQKSRDGLKSPGLGPRESVGTPRTEPLVDCGVLVRAQPTSYRYALSAGGQVFVSALALASSVDDFVEKGLASAVPGIVVRKDTDVDACARQYLARSYLALRSGLGYASIREVSALAVALAIDDTGATFDILDVETLLQSLARQYGRDLRFTRSRRGEVAQVRIGEHVLSQLTDGWSCHD